MTKYSWKPLELVKLTWKNGILANFADSSESIIRVSRQKFEFGGGPPGSDQKPGEPNDD